MHASGTKLAGSFHGDPERLGDPGAVADFLRDLIEGVGMTMLGSHIYDVPKALRRLGVESDDGGVTGVAVLSTSHAAIHTWPSEGAARLDVDSCRSFDPAVVERLVRAHFGAQAVRLRDVSDVYECWCQRGDGDAPRPSQQA